MMKKINPFMMTVPYRKQPQRRVLYYQENPMNTMVSGMVTLGTIAIIGGTAVGILNAFQK